MNSSYFIFVFILAIVQVYATTDESQWVTDLRNAVVSYKSGFFPGECDVESFKASTEEDTALIQECVRSSLEIPEETQKNPVAACTPECKASAEYTERVFPGCEGALQMAIELTVKNASRAVLAGPLNATLIDRDDAEILSILHRSNQQPNMEVNFFEKWINGEPVVMNITDLKNFIYIMNTNLKSAGGMLNGCSFPPQMSASQQQDSMGESEPVEQEEVDNTKSSVTKFRKTLVEEYGDFLPEHCTDQSGEYTSPTDSQIEKGIQCTRAKVDVLYPSPQSQCPASCIENDPELEECLVAEDALISVIANQWINQWISQGDLPSNDSSVYGSQKLFASIVNAGTSLNLSDTIFDEDNRRVLFLNDTARASTLAQYLLKDMATSYSLNTVLGCYSANSLAASSASVPSGAIGLRALVLPLYLLFAFVSF
jgi:hypothetical protein